MKVAVRSLLLLLPLFKILFVYYLIVVVVVISTSTSSSVVAAAASASSAASAASSSSSSSSSSIPPSIPSSSYSSPWLSSSSWNRSRSRIRRTRKQTSTKTIIPPSSSQQEEEKENSNYSSSKKKDHNNRPFFFLSRLQQPFLCSRGGCKDGGDIDGNNDGSGVSHHPAFKKPRRACGFYVWNAPSALLYKWCHHLLKDHLYEGRGGHMFVRYESNSILQLLYPCNRFSPNQCLICGGSFPDHLELWWSKKHLYSPYDQYLETTYKNSLVLQQQQQQQQQQHRGSKSKVSNRSINNQRRRQRQRQQRSSSRSSRSTTQSTQSTIIIKEPPKFRYHTAYVKDVSDWIKNEKSIKNQMEIIKTNLLQEQKQDEKKCNKNKKNRIILNRNNNRKGKGNNKPLPPTATTKGMRLTRFPQYDVAYILPTTTSTPTTTTTSTPTKSKSTNNNNNLIKSFIRSITISTLDDLIMLQEKENKKLSSSSS